MLEIAPNPYADPIKKFIGDLKEIEWKFPFLVQIAHVLITLLILLIVLVLYLTVGIVSQISQTFWDLLVGMGERMTFSHPVESTAYVIATVVYFILFLPFFILQSPIWFSGWMASKIGFKPFITILLIAVTSGILYYFNPNIAVDTYDKIIGLKSSVESEFNTNDSLSVPIEKEIETQKVKK